jgi:hypothetical protein
MNAPNGAAWAAPVQVEVLKEASASSRVIVISHHHRRTDDDDPASSLTVTAPLSYGLD